MKRTSHWRRLGVSGLMLAASLAAQQVHGPADIEQGGRLYRSFCVICHGPDGNEVPGVDFGRGFRRAYSDDEVVRIIQSGISGTIMPASDFSETEARNIVGYLRSTVSTSQVAVGDPGRGNALFEGKGACLNCHRVNGAGSRLGPDLSDVGALRRPEDLERSLLEPAASVLPEHRSVRLVTRDGVTVTGRLLSQDTFTVLILDAQERLRSFARSNLRDYTVIRTTTMPSYRSTLSAQEVADLVGYLISLKGIASQ